MEERWHGEDAECSDLEQVRSVNFHTNIPTSVLVSFHQQMYL